MSEALKLWMRECWELWYWAMFCPSRLQERMNEWSPKKVRRDGNRPDTTFQDLLKEQINWRFLLQFIQIACCFCAPIVTIIAVYSLSIDWLLLPVILLTTYCGSFWNLSIGLNVPLILFQFI